MPRIGIAVVVLSLLASEAAFAQATLGESAKELIGSWEFSTADRELTCTVTFKADPAGKGRRVESLRWGYWSSSSWSSPSPATCRAAGSPRDGCALRSRLRCGRRQRLTR